MIKKSISILRKIYIEVLIILVLVLCINKIIGNSESRIHSDGMGYYEYLPSIFIFHDLDRYKNSVSDSSILYNRIEKIKTYNDYKGYKVNKYSCGTALLQAPFFLITYFSFHLEHSYKNGNQHIFHETIYVSTLFYLFLALCFLKGLLQLYKIEKSIIIFAQLILVFSTSVIVYTNIDASFSHIYSLSIITIFLYVVKKYFLYKNKNLILIACILLGLILLLRQVNFLVLLFLPFLAGSGKNLKESTISLYKELPTVVFGIICLVSVFSIQLIFWYLQTGDFILYSYQGETFDFSNPQFINILFSYKRGLFVYTPILLLSVLAIVWMFFVRKFYLAISWLTGFLLLTYVLCSWWSWCYGAGYGLRAYIDYYSLFLIPIVIFFQQIKLVYKYCILSFSICVTVLNVIQTYQYKEKIIHEMNMDRESYWKVFLKTDQKYKNLLLNRKLSKNEFTVVKEYQIGTQSTSQKIPTEIFRMPLNKLPNIDKINLVRLTMEDIFEEADESKIVVSIKDTLSGKYVYWNNPYIIHFAQQGFNHKQLGVYNFFLSNRHNTKHLNPSQEILVELEPMKGKKTINNISIQFCKMNELAK